VGLHLIALRMWHILACVIPRTGKPRNRKNVKITMSCPLQFYRNLHQPKFVQFHRKSKGFWKKVWVDVRFPIKSSTNDFLETIYGNQPYKSNNHYRNKIYKIKIPKQILCIKQAITLWALENVASWHILFCISFLLVKVWHSQGLHGADTSGLIWS
jgi:hypothetical protein